MLTSTAVKELPSRLSAGSKPTDDLEASMLSDGVQCGV
jgi:hypothetical protein